MRQWSHSISNALRKYDHCTGTCEIAVQTAIECSQEGACNRRHLSEAESHAIIKHRNCHIVMNHGSLHKVVPSRGPVGFPTYILAQKSMFYWRYSHWPLSSPISCVNQALNKLMLKSPFMCSNVEKVNCPADSLLVEVGWISSTEGVSKLIPCCEAAGHRVLYGTKNPSI